MAFSKNHQCRSKSKEFITLDCSHGVGQKFNTKTDQMFTFCPQCNEVKKVVLHELPELTAEIHYLKGLPNIDLSCSVNVLLQVLAQAPKLASVLQEEQSQQSSFCSVLLLLIKYINGDTTRRSSEDIKSDLRWIRRHLYQRTSSSLLELQNDSHLLLMNMLNELKEAGVQDVVELFQIEMLDVIECNTCRCIEMTTDQTFYSLSIPLCRKKMTVEKGINSLFREEKMELDCRKCTSRVCIRRLCIKRLPTLLVLQLPRTEKNSAGKIIKVQELIQYETKISIEDAMNKTFTYELYGIIEHNGTLDEGHYMAHVLKCYPGHKRLWFRCSDEHIMKESNVTQITDAYLLFYAKT